VEGRGVILDSRNSECVGNGRYIDSLFLVLHNQHCSLEFLEIHNTIPQMSQKFNRASGSNVPCSLVPSLQRMMVEEQVVWQRYVMAMPCCSLAYAHSILTVS